MQLEKRKKAAALGTSQGDTRRYLTTMKSDTFSEAVDLADRNSTLARNILAEKMPIRITTEATKHGRGT